MKPFVITSALSAIQLNQHWQRHFPFLKLLFYTPDNRIIKGYKKGIPLNKMSFKVNGPNWLVIYTNIKIDNFEKLFQATFGLKVEVRRKIGSSGNDTNYFKNQTLTQQNNNSKVFSLMHQPDN